MNTFTCYVLLIIGAVVGGIWFLFTNGEFDLHSRVDRYLAALLMVCFGMPVFFLLKRLFTGKKYN